MPAYLVVPLLVSLAILPQPPGCSMCVTDDPGALTLFSAPLEYDVTGLLAHDYLAGRWFYELEPGELVALEYSDRVAWYVVRQVVEYPAAGEPRQREIFNEIYTAPDRLILQTCTDAGGWHFVIAVPCADPAGMGWVWRH